MTILIGKRLEKWSTATVSLYKCCLLSSKEYFCLSFCDQYVIKWYVMILGNVIDVNIRDISLQWLDYVIFHSMTLYWWLWRLLMIMVVLRQRDRRGNVFPWIIPWEQFSSSSGSFTYICRPRTIAWQLSWSPCRNGWWWSRSRRSSLTSGCKSKIGPLSIRYCSAPFCGTPVGIREHVVKVEDVSGESLPDSWKSRKNAIVPIR